MNAYSPQCLWFTGLSGAGKTTIATALHETLKLKNKVKVIDGDILREGLCSDLGFSESDRHENLRRMSHLAKIFFDEGYIVLVSAITPFNKDRFFARSLFKDNHFKLIHINTSIEVCENRDVKGLYKRARKGLIYDFTGISSPYEEPENPEITIDTSTLDVNDSVKLILDVL